MDNVRQLNNNELVAQLRHAASVWFKNSDMLLLEELIRRNRWQERELIDFRSERSHDESR